MMAKVYIENVHPDLVFSWFYDTVKSEGGDGCAALCCGNIEDAYTEFLKWAEYKRVKKYLPEYVDRNKVVNDEKTGNMINIHDCNENFIFCDYDCDLRFGDVSFVIKEEYECNQSFILRKV